MSGFERGPKKSYPHAPPPEFPTEAVRLGRDSDQSSSALVAALDVSPEALCH